MAWGLPNLEGRIPIFAYFWDDSMYKNSVLPSGKAGFFGPSWVWLVGFLLCYILTTHSPLHDPILDTSLGAQHGDVFQTFPEEISKVETFRKNHEKKAKKSMKNHGSWWTHGYFRPRFLKWSLDKKCEISCRRTWTVFVLNRCGGVFMLGHHEHVFWIWQPCWMFTRILQDGSLPFPVISRQKKTRNSTYHTMTFKCDDVFLSKCQQNCLPKAPTHTHTQIIFQAYSVCILYI